MSGLTKDEARRIAANIAKLPELLRWENRLFSLYSHGEYWHCAPVGEEGTGFAVSTRGEESVADQTRCRLGNLARASLSVMQVGEPYPSDGPIVMATARIGIMRTITFITVAVQNVRDGKQGSPWEVP